MVESGAADPGYVCCTLVTGSFVMAPWIIADPSFCDRAKGGFELSRDENEKGPMPPCGAKVLPADMAASVCCLEGALHRFGSDAGRESADTRDGETTLNPADELASDIWPSLLFEGSGAPAADCGLRIAGSGDKGGLLHSRTAALKKSPASVACITLSGAGTGATTVFANDGSGAACSSPQCAVSTSPKLCPG